MRVGIVADVHLGNHRQHGGPMVAGVNRRAREVADVLLRAVEAALDHGCKRLVIAGDLFDTSHPSPQLVRLAQEALGNELPTYVLAGNHDIESALPGDNALGPLRALPSVQVVERPAAFALARATLLCVPFQPGDAREWLPRVVDGLLTATFPMPAAADKVLVTHLGIVDLLTEPFLRSAHDAIELDRLSTICRQHDIGHVLAGNWHTTRRWDRNDSAGVHAQVVQVGTLCPTGWDNAGPTGYGSLWIYDESSGLERVEIPGPRFFTILNHDQLSGLERAQATFGHHVYVRWAVGPTDSVAEARAVLQEMVAAGKLTAAEANEDGVDAAAMARQAAKAAAEGARSAADGLDAVLAAFVEQMPLPEGVDRAAVLSEAHRLLAAG